MSDLINRQDAIDVALDIFPDDEYYQEQFMKGVQALPSVESEIIRCGECKWYGRTDKRRFYRGMDCLNKHIDTIAPDRDFCSRAERRTDEGLD